MKVELIVPPGTVAGSGANNYGKANLNGTLGPTNPVIPINPPPKATGMMLQWKTTATSGTSPTLTLKAQYQNHAGDWTDVPGFTTTAINTVTNGQIALHPALPETANAKIAYILPSKLRLVGTVGGSATPTVTFSAVLEWIYN